MATPEQVPLTLREAGEEALPKLDVSADVKTALTPTTESGPIKITKKQLEDHLDTATDSGSAVLLNGKDKVDMTFEAGQSLNQLIAKSLYGKGYGEISNDQRYFIVSIEVALRQHGVNVSSFQTGDQMTFDFIKGTFFKHPKAGTDKSGDLTIELSRDLTSKTRAQVEAEIARLEKEGILYEALKRYGDDPSFAGRVKYMNAHNGFIDLINHYLGEDSKEALGTEGLDYKGTPRQNIAFLKAYLAVKRNEQLGTALPVTVEEEPVPPPVPVEPVRPPVPTEPVEPVPPALPVVPETAPDEDLATKARLDTALAGSPAESDEAFRILLDEIENLETLPPERQLYYLNYVLDGLKVQLDNSGFQGMRGMKTCTKAMNQWYAELVPKLPAASKDDLAKAKETLGYLDRYLFRFGFAPRKTREKTAREAPDAGESLDIPADINPIEFGMSAMTYQTQTQGLADAFQHAYPEGYLTEVKNTRNLITPKENGFSSFYVEFEAPDHTPYIIKARVESVDPALVHAYVEEQKAAGKECNEAAVMQYVSSKILYWATNSEIQKLTPKVNRAYDKMKKTEPKAPETTEAVPNAKAQAEYVREAGEMKTYAKRPNMKAVNDHYQTVLKLEAQGAKVDYATHLLGAQAAEGLGDIKAASKAWAKAAEAARKEGKTAEADSAQARIEAINQGYGGAEILVNRNYTGELVLEPFEAPFAPEERAAIERANKELHGSRSFQGVLPIGNYTIGGTEFTVTSGAASANNFVEVKQVAPKAPGAPVALDLDDEEAPAPTPAESGALELPEGEYVKVDPVMLSIADADEYSGTVTIEWPADGTTYQGEMRNNVPHGTGLLTMGGADETFGPMRFVDGNAVWTSPDGSVTKRIVWDKGMAKFDVQDSVGGTGVREVQALAIPSLATDLSADDSQEITANWAQISASSLATPFIAASGRAYIRTDAGVFYNSKPDEKHSFGKIDEINTTYFLLNGQLEEAHGVGDAWGTGSQKLYSLFQVEGDPESVFDSDGEPLEKVGSIWKQTTKEGDVYYHAPAEGFAQCDINGLTEKKYREALLVDLKKDFPNLEYHGENRSGLGTSYNYALNVNGERFEVEYGGQFIVKNGVAEIRALTKEYSLPDYQQRVRTRAGIVKETIPLVQKFKDLPLDSDIRKTRAYFDDLVKTYSLDQQLDGRSLTSLANNLVWFTVETQGSVVPYAEVQKYVDFLESDASRGDEGLDDTLMQYYSLSGNTEKAKLHAQKIVDYANTGATDVWLADSKKKAEEILK